MDLSFSFLFFYNFCFFIIFVFFFYFSFFKFLFFFNFCFFLLIVSFLLFYFSLHRTISESRSYDETTIQPPTKSYRHDYDSKPSSQHQNDVSQMFFFVLFIFLSGLLLFQEANTMAERDLGSTFLLPHTHLYKPDRVRFYFLNLF